jgi:hypothetical protein
MVSIKYKCLTWTLLSTSTLLRYYGATNMAPTEEDILPLDEEEAPFPNT